MSKKPPIEVVPGSLEWTAKVGERQSQTLTLRNPSADRDACYKIKTTCVARYAVLPGQALIPAGATAEVEIVLIKMDELPVPTDLKDRFLIQAAWKDDPGEEVAAFWKRGPKKDELFQKKFSSELFLADETEEQKQEERAEAAAEMEEESVQELEEETAAVEAKMQAYDTNNDGVLDEAELEVAAKSEAKAKHDAEAAALQEAEERYAEEQAAAAAAKEEAARIAAEAEAAKAAETRAKNAQKAKAKQERIEKERLEKEAAAQAEAEKLDAEKKAAEATRKRSPSSSGPSLAMQIRVPDLSMLTSDPISALGQYATPLSTKLCATPLKMAIEPIEAAAGLPKEFVVFMLATTTLLLMILFAGLSAVTTILGLLLPALWSLQMLCSPLDAATATAMPLYWIIFTSFVILEDVGVMAWVPFYWLIKPVLLIFLWGFQGAEMLCGICGIDRK